MNLRRTGAPLLLIAAFAAACSGASTGGTPSAPASVAPASAGSAPASSAPAASSAAPTSSSAASAAESGGYKSGGGYGGGGSASPAAGASASTGGLALVKVSLGTVLVGPTGNTLYLFTPDTSSKTACTDQCAATWPPLTGARPPLGKGLDAGDFGSITRPDGTKQVTFYGHPLYYFSGDQAPGDTRGEGLGGKWFVVSSEGNPIK